MWKKFKFLSLFKGHSASARVLRVILPLLISIIILQGILNVILTHYYDLNPAFLFALLTIFSIILSVLVILNVIRLVFQSADKAEMERIKTENIVAISEKKYRYLFDNNPQPMWIYDVESLEFLEVNEYATQHYGYSRNEFLTMTVNDICPIEDVKAPFDEMGKNTNEFFTQCFVLANIIIFLIFFIKIYLLLFINNILLMKPLQINSLDIITNNEDKIMQ